MKILLLDLETAPNTATVWGLYDQTIAINQLIESSYVMCFSAKWLGEKEILWHRGSKRKRKEMLNAAHKLLAQADSVVHFNGSKFDIPVLNREFIIHSMPQPSPYKQIDLLRVARSQFKFTSNKLDYIVQTLGLGRKTRHHGHELWLGCMNNDPKCWKIMQRYNMNDVRIMERLYYRLLPWMKTHTNHSLYADREKVCPNCGSDQIQCRGYAFTHAGKYQRYQCRSCASWFRGTKNIKRNSERFVTI